MALNVLILDKNTIFSMQRYTHKENKIHKISSQVCFKTLREA